MEVQAISLRVADGDGPDGLWSSPLSAQLADGAVRHVAVPLRQVAMDHRTLSQPTGCGNAPMSLRSILTSIHSTIVMQMASHASELLPMQLVLHVLLATRASAHAMLPSTAVTPAGLNGLPCKMNAVGCV